MKKIKETAQISRKQIIFRTEQDVYSKAIETIAKKESSVSFSCGCSHSHILVINALSPFLTFGAKTISSAVRFEDGFEVTLDLSGFIPPPELKKLLNSGR